MAVPHFGEDRTRRIGRLIHAPAGLARRVGGEGVREKPDQRFELYVRGVRVVVCRPVERPRRKA